MTRDELNKMLDDLQRDLWEVLRKHGVAGKTPDHVVEEFALYLALGLKPTWET